MAELAVIIPAYNAERGLERSVRSVLNQTFRDLEVWITDDGSKDATGKIADRLVTEDPRVHVIHQQNQGCYMARVNALKRINAPYFGFVDADDEIAPTMYERMLSAARQTNADVVQCNAPEDRVLADRDAVMREYVKPDLLRGRTSTFVWDKIYRNQLDSPLPTVPITTYEDVVLNLLLFRKILSMVTIRDRLYDYCVNDGSSVRNFKWRTAHDFGVTCCMRWKLLPEYSHSPCGATALLWYVKNALNIIRMAVRSVFR